MPQLVQSEVFTSSAVSVKGELVGRDRETQSLQAFTYYGGVQAPLSTFGFVGLSPTVDPSYIVLVDKIVGYSADDSGVRVVTTQLTFFTANAAVRWCDQGVTPTLNIGVSLQASTGTSVNMVVNLKTDSVGRFEIDFPNPILLRNGRSFGVIGPGSAFTAATIFGRVLV